MVLGKIIALAIIIALSVYFIGQIDTSPKDLTSCLNNKNLTFYFEENCPHSQEELKILNGYQNKIKFINCTETKDLCTSIPAVPAFSFNGTLEYGTKNETELMSMLGC